MSSVSEQSGQAQMWEMRQAHMWLPTACPLVTEFWGTSWDDWRLTTVFVPSLAGTGHPLTYTAFSTKNSAIPTSWMVGCCVCVNQMKTFLPL